MTPVEKNEEIQIDADDVIVLEESLVPEKRPVGRPSKYKPEYCDKIIEYFDREPLEALEIPIAHKKDENGNPETKTIMMPCQCPTFEKFCADVNISRQTLHDWCKKIPEFLDAYNRARNMQAHIMMTNGMSGHYNAGFTGLSMKNMHGWADKQEIDNTHTINQMPTVTLDDKPLIFDVGDKVDE